MGSVAGGRPGEPGEAAFGVAGKDDPVGPNVDPGEVASGAEGVLAAPGAAAKNDLGEDRGVARAGAIGGSYSWYQVMVSTCPPLMLTRSNGAYSAG